jgi:hypothetical protein
VVKGRPRCSGGCAGGVPARVLLPVARNRAGPVAAGHPGAGQGTLLFMDEKRRDALLEAHAAWREAEDAYHAQSAKHVFVSWVNDPTPHTVEVEPLTKQALERLTELRQAAADAQQDYQDLLGQA